MSEPVFAVVPKPWAPPYGCRRSIDFAQGSKADAWLRHPVLGDPSFDSFQRLGGNPLLR